MLPAIALLTFVTLQRLAELVHAKRNTKALMAKGGREIGAEHYPYMVVMHAAWLVGLWIFGWNQPINLFWLAVFAVLQLLRVWILATLGGDGRRGSSSCRIPQGSSRDPTASSAIRTM